MTQKSTESAPRKSAPDVIKRMAYPEQVRFYRPAVLRYEPDEAFNSPSAVSPSWRA